MEIFEEIEKFLSTDRLSQSENEEADEISMEEVEKAVERGNIYIDK